MKLSARGRLPPVPSTPAFCLPLTHSGSASSSLPLRRNYALTFDPRGFISGGRGGADARVKKPLPLRTFLRADDAAEIENRFLKWVTPQGKDPWHYNRHLLPKWRGMKGDAHVSFNSLQTPEDLVASFLDTMTYPSELGHGTRVNVFTHRNRPGHHWADERIFGLPPVAIVRLHYTNNQEMKLLRYAEVHWWRQTLKVWEVKKVSIRGEEGMSDEVLGDVDESDYEVTREAAEYPIPPRWLFELKKQKWPAPPRPEELTFPSGDMQPAAKEPLVPFAKERFPHAQADMLGRPYWDLPEEEEEDVALDPEDETEEELVTGNAFMLKEGQQAVAAGGKKRRR